MRAFLVTRTDYPGNSCTYRDGGTLIDAEFDGAEAGDSIQITLLDMTAEQLDALPEFEGW